MENLHTQNRYYKAKQIEILYTNDSFYWTSNYTDQLASLRLVLIIADLVPEPPYSDGGDFFTIFEVRILGIQCSVIRSNLKILVATSDPRKLTSVSSFLRRSARSCRWFPILPCLRRRFSVRLMALSGVFHSVSDDEWVLIVRYWGVYIEKRMRVISRFCLKNLIM